jgi:dCTP deaminase
MDLPMRHEAGNGVLSDTQIRILLREGGIVGPVLADRQVQPASLDLRLGDKAYRIRASLLPGHETVAKAIEAVTQEVFSLDDRNGLVIPPGSIFLIPLQESLQLPLGISARANPKSSTGRLDIFVRVITDFGTAYEQIPDGYQGPLWLEVAPITFPVRVRKGSRLSQIRFRSSSHALTDDDITSALAADALRVEGPANLRNGLCLGLNLDFGQGRPIGWRARRHTDVIDVDRVSHYDATEFFEPVFPRNGGTFVLDPGEFYILASAERFEVSNHLCAEMIPVDTDLGEYRGHSAGFIDCFFGWNNPSRLVLELRTRDVPFLVRHSQPIARLAFEPMSGAPSMGYGEDGKSNDQGQSLRLSKNFREESYAA